MGSTKRGVTSLGLIITAQPANRAGMASMSESIKGAFHGLIGPLPEQIQSTISYSAAVITDAPTPEVAREFIQYLETPPVKAIFAAAGFDN